MVMVCATPSRRLGMQNRWNPERPRIARRLCASIVLFTCAGCAVGPDFKSPPPPDTDRFTPEKTAIIAAGGPGRAPAQKLTYGADIPARWWSVFRNRPLNDLVAAAIDRNPSLQAAEAAIRAAFYNAESQKGSFLPQLAINAGASRNLASNNVSVDSIVRNNLVQNLTGVSPLVNVPSSLNTPYGLFLGQLSVSYTLDIWGQNRRSVEALEAQTDQQRYQLEAAHLALTGNIVAAAIQEATLRGQIAATKRVIAIGRDLLRLLNAQFDRGQVSRADVLAQEAGLALVMQLLPPLEKQLALQRNLLTALAGQYSSAEVVEKFSLEAIELPRELPVSLPSKFVRQRPDVRAAEANMHSASAQIGVAIAARLPNLTLNGSRGASAFDLAQLFAPGTGFYTIAANLAQPVFAGFSLLNKQRSTEAALDQAEAQYRQTVITAFQNVADALRALQSDAKAVKAAAYAEETAKKSLDIVQAQLKSGYVNQLAVLNAQQTYLQASVAHVQARGARLADVAGLFVALGGSWRDANLEALPPTGPGSPTAAEIETIKSPANASWFPSVAPKPGT